MALSFPLQLAAFFDGLKIAESTFDLTEALETNETGDGEYFTSDYGPRLWEGSLTVRAENPDRADELVARAELLRSAGATFFVSRKHRLGPIGDREGVKLGSSAPVISALATNNREISISGLPSLYAMKAGDMLSFTYLNNPMRYALHRVVTNKEATAAGVLSNLEIIPPLRPGAVINTPITLIKPFCKAAIIPGSFEPQRSVSSRAYGFSFRWRQKLK